MKLKVIPEYYAPKIDGFLDFGEKIHCVVWPKCNFKCKYCDFWQRDDIIFKEITLDNFDKVVVKLMERGKAFKFTGGEPCLNPFLKEMLKIVKDKGGINFLDTNGSLVRPLTECIDNGLIDVLAISVKGLNIQNAIETSGIINKCLCWDNVIKNISYASERNVKTLITYVITKDFSLEHLKKFASIISEVGNNNIFLKLNNLMINNYNQNYEGADSIYVKNMISSFLEEYPEYINRVIYIQDKSAITEQDEIQHF